VQARLALRMNAQVRPRSRVSTVLRVGFDAGVLSDCASTTLRLEAASAEKAPRVVYRYRTAGAATRFVTIRQDSESALLQVTCWEFTCVDAMSVEHRSNVGALFA
jgi:hypothetical protein